MVQVVFLSSGALKFSIMGIRQESEKSNYITKKRKW